MILGSRVVALAAVMVVLSACGQATGAAVSGSHTGAKNAVSKAQIADWQSQLDQLYADIAGTPSQRVAGDVVAFHVEQDPFTSCAQAQGVGYTPPAVIDQWSGWPLTNAGSFSTSWLATTTDPDHLGSVIQNEAAAQRAQADDEAKREAAYEGLSQADQQAWDAALKQCSEGQNYSEAYHPSGYYPLLTAYRSLLNSSDAAAMASAGGYPDCMNTAGYKVTDHFELVDYLTARAPAYTDIPPPGQSGGDAWAAWVTDEHAAMAADANCRAEAYAAGWTALGPSIAMFEADHAQALADEEQGWKDLVGQANQEAQQTSSN